MNLTQKSPERAFALQKYLLLHSQHDSLQKHLNQITTGIIPTASPTTPERHRNSSLSSSPGSSSGDGMYLARSPPPLIRNHRRSGSISASHQRPPITKRRFSLPTVIDESIIDEIEQDEIKLKDINLQIKGTLTDLLNCESVRTDNRYRTWVQSRLMDAERELRCSRTKSCERRRSEDWNDAMK